MRLLDEIIVHASDTPKGWWARKSGFEQTAEITRWHVDERGWDDIGYHYVIDREGVVHNGRPLEKAGAHCRGYNARSVGICLIGGRGGKPTDRFLKHYTRKQEQTLVNLIRHLQDAYGPLEVSGHNRYSTKACPCFGVRGWWLKQQKPKE